MSAGFPRKLATEDMGDLMRSILLRGLSSLRVRAFSRFQRLSRRIKERALRDAISLSLARKRPDLNFGGVTTSSASSLIVSIRQRPLLIWRAMPHVVPGLKWQPEAFDLPELQITGRACFRINKRTIWPVRGLFTTRAPVSRDRVG